GRAEQNITALAVSGSCLILSPERAASTRYDKPRDEHKLVRLIGEMICNEFSFKYYVTEMICWATGGPQNYTGRSMTESHKHLKIPESEWAGFCKDFDDTMAKFNVPEAEHKELFAIVESTKGDIVIPSTSQ